MWKTKTERKTGEKVAVAKAYSSTDRKSPIQSVGSPAMQPPYPMEESNQDRKKDAVIESITSHYSLNFYIEKRYSTREKGRTKGRLLWFNWTVRTRYLISSHGRASFFQRSWWKGLERDFGWERDCSRNRSSCGCLGWSETISRVLGGAGGSLYFLFSLCTQRVWSKSILSLPRVIVDIDKKFSMITGFPKLHQTRSRSTKGVNSACKNDTGYETMPNSITELRDFILKNVQDFHHHVSRPSYRYRKPYPAWIDSVPFPPGYVM